MRVEPAIVVVAYNRPLVLKRLLESIEHADYIGYSNIRLIISIDHSENEDCYKVADDFQWTYGFKQVIKLTKNIGLRNHILACGELTQEHGAAIILEDDCFVSRNFYDYACQGLTFYQYDLKIAGLSLYSYRLNEHANLPFYPLEDGYSSYFAQVPSSWGQCWTAAQWKNFKTYYESDPIISEADQLPDNVKGWPDTSWKKYYYKYMVEKDLYFVYPAISLATNFGEKGTHFNEGACIFQVPVETRVRTYNYSFASFDISLNKYDAYFEILPECLQKYGAEIPEGTGIDLFGTKQLALFNYEYLISIKDCMRPVRSYGLEMLPEIQNLIHSINGGCIHLGKAADFSPSAAFNMALRAKRFQSVGYDYGVAAGLAAATVNTKNSNSYKLGYFLLHPLKSIKDLFKPMKYKQP